MRLEKAQGVRKGINEQLDALERKAYKAGYEDGQKESRRLSEDEEGKLRGEGACMLAGAIRTVYEKYREEVGAGFYGAYMTVTELLKGCPIEFIGLAEEIRKEEQAKEKAGEEADSKPYEPKVGDTVKDRSGNECKVTNTDTHVHVLYPNGKTKKWDKTDRFTLVDRHEWVE